VISGLQRIFRRRRLATVLLWAVLIVLALATLSPGRAATFKSGSDEFLDHQLDTCIDPCNFVELMPRLTKDL